MSGPAAPESRHLDSSVALMTPAAHLSESRRPDCRERRSAVVTPAIAVLVFVAAAGAVVVAGVRLAKAGDQLAERTGLGRLFVGTETAQA